MRKAWIENGVIRDIANGIPNELYHPDIAANYFNNVPDNAAAGDLWDGSTLTKPVSSVPQAQAAIPPIVSKNHFLLLFSSAERVKARALRLTDPILDDFWLLLDGMQPNDNVNLCITQVQLGIEYTLAAVNAAGVTIDVQARKAAILTGEVS